MTTLELEKGVSFKNILVATDFSPASERALEYAAAITGLNLGKLFIAHALSPAPHLAIPLDPLPASLDRELAEGETSLQKTVSTEALHHIAHKEILERGPVREVVLDLIEREKIDLLVLGTRGRSGLRKVVLGSIAEELFRSAACPVLTVGPSAAMKREIRKVLFATDFEPASLRALPYAIDFANRSGAELLMLHLVSPVPVEFMGPLWFRGCDVVHSEKASAQRSMRKLQELVPPSADLKCSVEHLVEVQFPADGIINVAQARGADLIVMGLKESAGSSQRLAAHMPWATAYDVVCQAGCPVLTVRA